MAVLVSSIITSAALTLVDTENVTWSQAELIRYLNEGMLETAQVKPDLVPLEATLTLVAGVSQELPDTGLALIDILRNGNASARVITEVDQQLLDECYRFWPSGTQETTIEHYTVNPALPRKFNVYPPAVAGTEVVATYGMIPTPVSATGDTLPVLDVYQAPLIQYVLYRAYAKNTKRQDLTKSAAARQEWARSIGARATAQAAISPKVATQPGVA
jgi:hypothetical protein